jgi:hypothetical protein
LASIGEQPAEEAATHVAEALDALSLTSRVEAYDILARTPDGERYREEAKRWLDELVEQLPPERRAACRERIVIHRRLSADG